METGFSVMDAMTKHPVMVQIDMTVAQCADKMAEYDIGSLLVQENGNIAGIITEEDVVRRVVAAHKQPSKTPVSEVMSRSVITISPDADIYEAMVKMRDNGIRHLPVTDNNQIIGFLTLKDILKIEPDLFDAIVEHFDIREEHSKPVLGDRSRLGGASEEQQEIASMLSEEYEPYSDDFDNDNAVVNADLEEDERIQS